MYITIDETDRRPIYRQVADEIKALIARGSLSEGMALPPVRQVADDLGVNLNTIAKAYTELESQGVIETMAGKGCFVSANNSPFKKEVRLRLLTDEIDAAVIQAHHLQVGRKEFLQLTEERFDLLEEKRAQAATS